MTVSTTDSVIEYVSGGPTFPIPYRFLQNSDIDAVLVKQDGTSETLTGAQYTLSGAGSQNGGTLTSSYAAGFLGVSGASLTISRIMDPVQPTDLRNQGKFLAETHETVFDRLTMLIQQGFAILRRALLRPIGKDYYDAENRRIANVADPVQGQDAATKKWTSVFVGGLIGAITGPINNALNIFYKYPDGSSHVVQDLSGANGSDGIGHDSTTVGAAIDELLLPASPTQLGRLKTLDPSSTQGGIDTDAAVTGAGLRAYDRSMQELRNTYNSWLSASSATGARTVNFVGDSIGFGAGAGNTVGDIRRNALVRILQRMLNIEHGGNNYGFVSSYDTNGTGREIHTVTQVPFVPGQFWGALQNAAAGHLPNGWALLSSQAGDIVRFGLQSEFRQVRVWFDGTQTGSFTVKLGDGTLLTTVTTTGAGTGFDRTIALTISDWTNGSSRIDITVVSGTVAICGLEYTHDTTQFALNNFSRDGRKAQYVAESVIDKMCNGAGALIFALGANDQLSVGADQTAVIQRMDWLIQYANQYKCRLIILDLLMWQPNSHWLRAQFRRVAAAVPGSLLVPMGNLISPNGVPLTAAELNTRNITSDGTHPTVQGHRMIAETLATLMGCSIRSKGLVNRMNNEWTGLSLVGGVTNSVSDVRAITAWRIVNSTLQIRFNCTCPVSGTLIGTVPLGFSSISETGNYILNPQSDGKAALIAINATGELRVFNDPGRLQGLPTALLGVITIPLNQNNEFPLYY
ncbi:hypothetical protein [Pseudomonas sp. DG56-2]|uniref:hypothetical protein n=1 Tax=Pseudomonas sp. DG56-2 TaxID=2320270 RepID=UPI0010A636FF|nr:hypothetical protein [Pseudomonas sp. DG56-2]